MGDWIDPSRRVGNTLSEITSEAIERMMQDQIVINPTAEQFERWDRASRIAQAPTLKEWIVAGLDKFAETDEREQQNASSIVPLRPHIHAAAGPPVFAEVTDWDGADDTVLVRINGLSMVPLLNDGEVIRMKHKRASRSPFMKKGLIYLVEYDGGYAVKRYNTRPATPEERDEEWVENGKVKVLESINPDFSEIIIKQPIEWIAWLDQSEK